MNQSDCPVSARANGSGDKIISNTGARWYAARLKIAIPWDTTIQQLKRQHFIGWIPIVRHVTFHMGKKLIVETPLFGPYIFTFFDMSSQQWRIINNTVGIARLLPQHNEFPEPVARGFVEELQARPTMAKIEELTLKYSEDSVVKILAGAFQGRFARVLASQRTATRVKLEAFGGREVVATIATNDLLLSAGEAAKRVAAC